MTGNYIYLHVLNEGSVISTELVLYGSENCYSFLGGTDHVFFHMRPNDFLKYEIIKWAKEKGLKNFILGGGYGGDDGIFKYKRSFSPNGMCDFYIGKKIFDKEKYKTLTDMRIKKENFEENSNFFPEYRR
ncbi:MAG: GNAT family N-acetyltransferase, partial [Candidatus Margulisbacteria bacterium]|nr:GNAT family N-acetyltransferase [Candidatus Margulisiibacteriota bacterium]